MNTIGSRIRSLAGPLEPALCRLYRAVFVNVAKTAAAIEPHIPRGAHVLDVGGGDGVMVNALLRLRPDLRVTMVDLQPSIGRFIDPDLASRVTLLPGTDVADYQGMPVDTLLLSDVLHHVPRDSRRAFVAQVESLVRTGGRLIVKDVQPGGFRSWLNLMADRYISGDKTVALTPACELIRMTQGVPTIALLQRSNYVIAFRY